MTSILGRYSEYAYALLRIVTGLLFLMHGTQKLFNWPPRDGDWTFPAGIILAAALIELIFGAMVMIGLFSGIAAFISSGTMAVAYFMAHFSTAAFWPIQNKGELAAIYAFLFLFIAAKGSGVWSVDSLFKGSIAASTD
jgi:putative oxidoreductase